MKKSIFLIFIFSALFFLTGSSPWEGAAAVAPAGDLPESGFFVATNSFPRNTIVDITNIETGRTTRVIVANTLSSSGLLAVVSREAAELIGMRSGSVSRIRMIQPSDPMAYARFAERLAGGAPYIDPSVNEESLLQELYSEDTYTPPVTSFASAPPVHTPLSDISDLNAGRGYVVDEPEWGGSGRLNIVEIPGFVVDPVQPFVEQPPERLAEVPSIIHSEQPVSSLSGAAPEAPETTTAVEAEQPPKENEVTYVAHMDYPEPEETPPPVQEAAPVIDKPVTPFIAENRADSDEIIKDVSTRIEEISPVEIVKDVPGFEDEKSHDDIDKQLPVFTAVPDSRDEIFKEAPGYITELPREEVIKDANEWSEPFIASVPALPEEPKETAPPEAAGVTETALVPREVVPLVPVESAPRVPGQSVYDIPFSDIIPGIVSFKPADTPVVIPESSFVQPVQPAASSALSLSSQVPVSAVTTLPAERLPVTPAVSPAAEPLFSAQTIPQLDRGQYYVQLAALHAEMIDNTVTQIDPRYKPVVFKDRDNLYRVLIGPLNQGESAAVLQRFKSIGYSDAFVRHGNY